MYIVVSAIPNFDQAQLLYLDIYIKEKKSKMIIIGGTIAGQLMAGLIGAAGNKRARRNAEEDGIQHRDHQRH